MMAGLALASLAGVLGAPALGQAPAPPPAQPSTPAKGPQRMDKVRFEPVGYDQIQSWAKDDHLAAFTAFLKSCDRVIAAAKAGTLAGKIATPPPLLAACAEALGTTGIRSAAAARAFFERNFVPHRVIHDKAQGLLTGYYEPVIEGSRTKTGRFQYPIHKRPPELVNLVHEAQRGAMGQKLTHGRKTEKGIEPFATREEIEKGALAGRGLELIYLADPVDKFFMQIQGSGRIRLTDGSHIRVHYDGKNGHPYASIGRYLIERGLLASEGLSMQVLGRWLRADPKRGQETMWRNPSYVFFRELTGAEAQFVLGVLDIPLTEMRSLAVDTTWHPIGMPVWLAAPTVKNERTREGMRRLMIAQDVGSAIRGPERGDIFFGSGDAAARIAGVTKEPGNFIVLHPRGFTPEPAAAARQPLPVSAPRPPDAAKK